MYVIKSGRMEEEELTFMSREHKAKKRKHQYGEERIAVKDGTRYYDAEGYIPQYWPNHSRCPTENVLALAPSKVHLPPGTAPVMVQASGVVKLQTANISRT